VRVKQVMIPDHTQTTGWRTVTVPEDVSGAAAYYPNNTVDQIISMLEKAKRDYQAVGGRVEALEDVLKLLTGSITQTEARL
jgi:hypothetical protein